MELKRIINLKFCMIAAFLILLNVILFVKDNYALGKTSRIYDEMVSGGRPHLSETNTVKEAALIGYKAYTAEHLKPDTTEEEKEGIKAARILLMAMAEYADNYAASLDEKIKNCEIQLKSSIFKEKNTFEYLNILKTRYDMKQIRDQKVTLSNGVWLSQLLDFRYTGIILLIISLLTVYSFQNEQKTGLVHIVRAAGKGRTPLFLKRAGILMMVSMVSSALLHAATAAASLGIHGGLGGLTDLVSCDSRYMLSGYGMNRLEYCIALVLFAGLGCFALSMLAWFVASFFSKSNGGLVFFVMIYGLEHVLYTFIPGKSIVRFLKYINIAAMTDAGGIFSTYRNWGYALGIISVFNTVLLAALSVSVLFLGLCCWRCAWKHPGGRGIVERIFSWIHERVMAGVARAPLIIKEIYKLLISQRIIVVLAVLLWLATDMKVGSKVAYSVEMRYYKEFFDKAQGLPYGTELAEILKGYEEDYEAFVTTIKEDDERGRETLELRRQMLDYIIRRTEYVREKNMAGIHAVILMPYEYEGAFGARQKDRQMDAAMLGLVAVLSLCSTFYTHEKKRGIHALVRAAARRRKWLVKKYLAAWIITGIFTGAVYGIYYFKLRQMYEIKVMDVAVQSLEMFSAVPINMTLGTFLAANVLLELAVLFSVAVMVSMAVSRLSYIYSMLAGFVLTLPQLVYMLGIRGPEKLSLCRYAAMLPMWGDGGQWFCYGVLAVLLALGASMFGIKCYKYR